MLGILVLPLDHQTVRTGPLLTRPALVRRAQKPTTAAIRTLHHELRPIRRRSLLTLCQRPGRRRTALRLRRIPSKLLRQPGRFTQNILPLQLPLTEGGMHLLHLLLHLGHLHLGLHPRLASRQQSNLPVKQDVLTVLLVRPSPERLGEVQIQELVIPRPPTSHAVSVKKAFGQIALSTHGARGELTVRTFHGLPQLAGELVAANRASAIVGHCGDRSLGCCAQSTLRRLLSVLRFYRYLYIQIPNKCLVNFAQKCRAPTASRS